MNTTENHDSAGRRSKATLICRVCGHESAVRGDWNRRPSGDAVVVECPDCGFELAERPRDDDATPEERPCLSC